MQFGVCGDPETGRAAKSAGYDFWEWCVADFLRPSESEDVFRRTLDGVQAVGLPCRAVNRLLPQGLRVTGPATDPEAVGRYVESAFMRAREAGVEIVVFGSGGARAVPAGFDRGAAKGQLGQFCAMAGELGRAYGITLVVEPLNRAECNILNTVSECAGLVRTVDHPNVRLLVDGYHWLVDRDSAQGIADNGDLLRHAHIGTAQSRLAPGAEPCEFGPFFGALREAGYSGGMCVEARIRDAGVDLPRALALMKRLAAAG